MSVGTDGQKMVIAGRYRLDVELGGGAFGRVYSASDLKFQPPRRVAIKLLREQFTSDPSIREQFVQEASNLAAFNHPNILTIHDFGLDEEAAYIVTPLADQGSLADVIRKQGRLSLEETGRYLEQIADAIEYAHSRRGVIHRDLKPQNILLDESGRLLVADLGLARIVEGSSSAMLTDVSSGTPSYMAPEQWQGQVGRSNDIYALGIILFEMLTGTRPFKGNQFELMGQHLHSSPPSVKKFVPELPAVLDEVIWQALAKDPKSRPRHATELAGLYRKAIQSTGDLQIPPASPSSGESRSYEDLTTPLPPVVGTVATNQAGAPVIPRPAISPSEKKPGASEDLDTSIATPPRIISPDAMSAQPTVVPGTPLAAPASTALRKRGLPKGKNLYFLFGGIAVILVALLAGFLLLSRNNSQSGSGATPAGRGEIRSLVFAPSGQYFYAVSEQSNVTIESIERPDGSEGWTVLPIESGAGLPHPMAVVNTPTGKTLAVADSNTIKLLSTDTNEEQQPPLTGHTAIITSLAVNPATNTLISLDKSGSLKFWDVQSRKELDTFADFPKIFALYIAVSPDGKILMAGDGTGGVSFYDLETKKELSFFKNAHSKSVTGIAFSPTDSGTAVSVSEDHFIKIWDVKAGTLKATIEAKTALYVVGFSLDGKNFATGGEDRIIRVWSLADQKNTLNFEGHTAKVVALALSPDGNMLVSGAADGTIKIWKL